MTAIVECVPNFSEGRRPEFLDQIVQSMLLPGVMLLDREMDAPVVRDLRAAIESDGDAQICDLHVWRVGRSKHAAVVVVPCRL